MKRGLFVNEKVMARVMHKKVGHSYLIKQGTTKHVGINLLTCAIRSVSGFFSLPALHACRLPKPFTTGFNIVPLNWSHKTHKYIDRHQLSQIIVSDTSPTFQTTVLCYSKWRPTHDQQEVLVHWVLSQTEGNVFWKSAIIRNYRERPLSGIIMLFCSAVIKKHILVTERMSRTHYSLDW